MSSSYNLYKGNARKRKGKVVGESSKSLPKRARVEEPFGGVPPAVPVVEVAESPDRGADSPRVVAEETHDEVPLVSSPIEEVGGSSKDARKEVFANLDKMTHEWVENVLHHKKYIKASSSFPRYNFGQAFSQGLNDITIVWILLAHLPW